MIFFPQTFLPGGLAFVLGSLFGRVAAILPSGLDVPDSMRRLQEKGGLDLIVPDLAPGQIKALRSFLSQTRVWGDMLRGQDLAYLKASGPEVPFFDENASSQILAALHDQPRDTRKDRDLAALVFLHVAQKWDESEWETSTRLMRVSERQAALMAAVHGRPEKPLLTGGDSAGAWTPLACAGHLIGRRMAAWADLLCRVPEPGLEFATASPEAMEILLKQNPEAVHEASCQDIVEGRTIYTDTFRFTEKSPQAVFSVCPETGHPSPAGPENNKNTLVSVVGLDSPFLLV